MLKRENIATMGEFRYLVPRHLQKKLVSSSVVRTQFLNLERDGTNKRITMFTRGCYVCVVNGRLVWQQQNFYDCTNICLTFYHFH